MSRQRVAYLDGLRAIAALVVFVTHAGGAGLRPLASFGPIGDWIITDGPYGVTIFFVVSAYTLCMSVAPALEGRPVSWRPLAFVGRISFSVYLLHPFLLGWAQGLGWRRVAEVLLAHKLGARSLDLRPAAAA